MMEQLKVLQRIKDLREGQALRLVNARRREVMEATAVLSTARNTVSQNETILPSREKAIFQPIIGQVVSFDDVEQAKADLQMLQHKHYVPNLLPVVGVLVRSQYSRATRHQFLK